MKLRTLLVVALAAHAAVMANRYFPFGRDLIFYSDDVAGFTLPNGKTVQTNKWYDRDDVLAEDQEFYTSGDGLGIMDPTVDGYAVTAVDGESYAVTVGDGDAPSYLNIIEMHTTVTHPESAGTPVGEKAVRPEGYDQYWIGKKTGSGPK